MKGVGGGEKSGISPPPSKNCQFNDLNELRYYNNKKVSIAVLLYRVTCSLCNIYDIRIELSKKKKKRRWGGRVRKARLTN